MNLIWIILSLAVIICDTRLVTVCVEMYLTLSYSAGYLA